MIIPCVGGGAARVDSGARVPADRCGLAETLGSTRRRS